MSTNGNHPLPMHELVTLFPPMSDFEYEALKDDIAMFGIHQPVAVWQGQVIDGRNRYRAALELGIEPPLRYLDNDVNPVDFVLSANMGRRNLDETQRGMVMAQLPKLERRENSGLWGSDSVSTLSSETLSVIQRAKRAAISRDLQSKCDAIIAYGDGDLIERCRSKKITANDAYLAIRMARQSANDADKSLREHAAAEQILENARQQRESLERAAEFDALDEARILQEEAERAEREAEFRAREAANRAEREKIEAERRALMVSDALKQVDDGRERTLRSAVNTLERQQATQNVFEQLNTDEPRLDWTYVDDTQASAAEAMRNELENGKNVIGSADAIELLRAMPDNSIDLLLSDIPYARVNKPSGGLRIIDKEDANEATFDLEEFAAEVFRVTRNNAVIFCGKEQFSPLYQHFDDRGLTTRMIVWEKTNPMPMNGSVMFLSGVECAVHFRKDRAPFNAQHQNTVFRFPSGSSLRHKTEKPLDMFKRFVELLSNPQDLVCDPCMGSGTAAVAAQQLGRRYLCSDIDPENAKLALLRLTENN